MEYKAAYSRWYAISVACYLLCVQNDVGIQRVYKKAVQAWSKMLAIKTFM